jgi:hypothetical protein
MHFEERCTTASNGIRRIRVKGHCQAKACEGLIAPPEITEDHASVDVSRNKVVRQADRFIDPYQGLLGPP